MTIYKSDIEQPNGGKRARIAYSRARGWYVRGGTQAEQAWALEIAQSVGLIKREKVAA